MAIYKKLKQFWRLGKKNEVKMLFSFFFGAKNGNQGVNRPNGRFAKNSLNLTQRSIHFLNLEKRPGNVQGCYTAQKMRKDLPCPTHDDSYHLNNYRSLYALISKHSLWKNSQNARVYEHFFLTRVSTNERVETPVIVQMIWIRVRKGAL